MAVFKLTPMRHFTTVAELRSIGLAARVLHISQPALTRSIQRLEKESDGALFERGSRGVELTARGRALLPHAKAMLDEADRAREELRQFTGRRRIHIRLGASPNFLESACPDVIAAFVDANPESTIATTGGTGEQLLSMLAASELDLGLVLSWGTTLQMALAKEPDIASEQLANVTVGVYAPAGHHLASAGEATLETLADQRWAVPHGLSLSYIFRDVFVARELQAPAQVVNASNMRQLLSLSERLGLLLIIPRHVVAEAGAGGRFVPLRCAPLELRYQVHLVTRRRGTQAAGVAEFRELIQRHFAQAQLA